MVVLPGRGTERIVNECISTLGKVRYPNRISASRLIPLPIGWGEGGLWIELVLICCVV
jgi:hypothetical protein